ncbi:hypothetical protein BS78_05G009300 [Paspalum vaginatum]|nr:hypothetical protein BS78_05G009300 [Paspalum vaginatum]
MAPAGNDDDDAPGATMQHAPALPSYRSPTPPPPPLTEHLLLVDNKPSPLCLDELPTFWRRKQQPSNDDNNVDWASVRGACKDWIINPMNMVLLLWLLCVGASGGMLVLLLLGLLDAALPLPADRARWVEVNSQVLNALFTLMSVYQHPALCHYLFLLCRWRRPRDAAHLRAAYCNCKGGGGAVAAVPRPRERAHLAVVVGLLHLTVLCQYALCALYWGYTKPARPELLEDGFFALGVAAPNKRPAPPAGHVVVVEPDWAGGMLDCGGGGGGSCLAAASCTFCVFGWNMERLGMGSGCVHAATFALLCFAPLCVLGVSALHIQDRAVGGALGGAGVLLCACGLLYGGYWRIQMRRKFGLPAGSTACCGSSSITDYARWLFCWPCALAQEVRTASLYHVDGELFYAKVGDGDGDRDDADSRQPLLAAASGDGRDVFGVTTESVAASRASPPGDRVVVVRDETTMAPPTVQVVVVQVEDDCSVAVNLDDMSDSLVPTTSNEDAALLETSQAMAEDDDDHGVMSDGSWSAEEVKKLINMVTVASLLILLYTRGIIL